MRFVELLLGAAAATLVLAAPAQDATPTTSEQKRKGKFEFTGVNESGAEFGQQAIPGQLNKDYIWPANSTIDVGQDVRARCWSKPSLLSTTAVDVDGLGDEHVSDPNHDVGTQEMGRGWRIQDLDTLTGSMLFA